MKLAEALILRSDMQKRLAVLKDRIFKNAQIQEGDQPSEDIELLIREYENVTVKLGTVIKAINTTNINSIISEDETIAERIVDRDMIKAKFNMYSSLVSEATVTKDRWGRSEIKFISNVNVSELRKKADSMAQKYREIDTAIHSKNWNVDLI